LCYEILLVPGPGHQIHKEKQPPLRSTAARCITYVLAGLGIAVFAISLWNSIGRNLDFPWTSIRLAPAFALAHGYPLYPVAYLPSVLAHEPGSAVATATVLAHLFILVPAGLIFSLLGKRLAGGLPVHWLFFWLFFALVTHLAPSLVYVTAGVHADAPAFGLFLLACYAVLRAEGATVAGQTRWLLAAGIAAGLSAACKLNLAAGMVALLVWTLRFFGWKRAAAFLCAGALAALTVYSWAVLRDGLAPVLLNLGQPAKMPWFTFRDSELASLSGSSHEFPEKLRTFLIFGRDYLKIYGAIALAVILIGFFPRESAEPDRPRRLVWFFLFLSLFLLPASIASISKYGGDVNSRALVSLPLALAALFALTSVVQRGHRGAIAATYAALAGAIFMVALPLKDGWAKLSTTPTLVEAHAVISADPGRWYFPYDPLAHLLVEGKFRPNMDVVYSYAASGFPVDESAFRSSLPENLRYVAIPPTVGEWGVGEIRRLLSDYSKPAPELNSARHRVYSAR